jgi:hypothetical protein
MFQSIIQSIIVIYIIFVIYNVLNLQKYNYNGYIVFYNENIDGIKEELKYLNPLHITIHNKFNLQDILSSNKSYIINDNDNKFPLEDINDYKHLYIHKNKELINDLNIDKYIYVDKKFFSNHDLLFYNHTLTIYKDVKTKLHRAFHNYNIIGILEGDTTFYLFNPKHKNDIIKKENNEIKKWGHKKIFQKGDILFIPTNWFYIQETKTSVIQYQIDIDNIFTYIPHFFKSSLT